MPGKLPGTRKNKNLAEFSKREQERVQLMISKEFSFIYNFDRGSQQHVQNGTVGVAWKNFCESETLARLTSRP